MFFSPRKLHDWFKIDSKSLSFFVEEMSHVQKVRLDESRMKAADIERRREMWEAHAFEEFISDLISPDR